MIDHNSARLRVEQIDGKRCVWLSLTESSTGTRPEHPRRLTALSQMLLARQQAGRSGLPRKVNGRSYCRRGAIAVEPGRSPEYGGCMQEFHPRRLAAIRLGPPVLAAVAGLSLAVLGWQAISRQESRPAGGMAGASRTLDPASLV